MADSNITQTTIAYLKLIESNYNAHGVTANLYQAIETQARLFVIPDNEKKEFTPRTGGGAASAYPTGQKSGVMRPVALDVVDTVNVQDFPTFARQHFGQTEDAGDIQVVDAAVAWRHHFYKQNFDDDGRQLDSRSWICMNNGAEFIYTGGVGSSLQIQQTGTNDPQYTAGIVTSGNAVPIADIGGFGSLTPPSADETKDMLGEETIITFDDGGFKTLQGRWISFNWTSNNNIQTQNLRAGLPKVSGAVCPAGGWYRDKLLADDESYSCDIRFAHDDAMNEYDIAKNNTVVTDFNIGMRGLCIPATTNDTQHGVDLNIGKSYFRNLVGGDDQNDAVIDMAVFGVRNGSFFGVHKMMVTSGQAGIYV